MNPKCLTDRTNRTELSDWSNRTELELYAVGSIHISAHNAAVVTLLSPQAIATTDANESPELSHYLSDQ